MPIPDEVKTKAEANFPLDYLKLVAKLINQSILSEEFSQKLDEFHIWPSFRSKFNIPRIKDIRQPGFFFKVFF